MRRSIGQTARRTVAHLALVWRHPANRGRRLRKLAENVAFQVNGRLRGKRYVAHIGERSLIWQDARLATAARAVIANPPDWPEMEIWRRFLEPGMVFVDIGANVGLYSIWALEQGATVIAVEPAALPVAMLRESLRLNGYEAEIVQAALGPTKGRMRFTVGWGGRNRLIDDPTDERTVEVDVLELDEVARGKRVSGIKIDVEGAERRALLGGREVLRDAELIQVEWNQLSWENFGEPRQPLADLLRGSGFILCRASDDARLRPITEEVVDVGPDVFAVSRSSPRAMQLVTS
jgi:FkbM family methyltransferase